MNGRLKTPCPHWNRIIVIGCTLIGCARGVQFGSIQKISRESPNSPSPGESSPPPPTDASCKEEVSLHKDESRLSVVSNKCATQPANSSISKLFDLSTTREDSLQVNLSAETYSQNFSMIWDYREESKGFHQVNRDGEKLHQQGTDNAIRREIFSQSESTKLDIQVVIDNSESMADEQVHLGTKLQSLLSYIHETNWRINVTTTDPYESLCSRGLILKGGTEPEREFGDAIRVGINGSNDEYGFRRAVDGLRCQLGVPSAPWYRPRSRLAVIIVSDEDNCSIGGLCSLPNSEFSYLSHFIQTTMGLSLGTEARLYGLIKVPGSGPCSNGVEQDGVAYAAAIHASKGTMGSICAPDYSPILQAISRDISTILRTSVTLSQEPTKGSVKVFINGVLETSGYSVVGKNIDFTKVPPAGATIEVEYFSEVPNPMGKVFPIGETPIPQSVKVFVQDIAVNAGEFQLIDQNIIFNQPPPAGSFIKIQYEKNVALSSRFDLGPGASPEGLTVKINGQETRDFRLEENTLLFLSPPPPKSKIDVTFRRKIGPKLRYIISRSKPEDIFLGAFGVDGIPIPVSYTHDTVEITADQFLPEKKVFMRFRLPSTGKNIVLTSDPISQSIKLIPSVGSCQAQGVSRNVQVVCDHQGDLEVTVKWRTFVYSWDAFTLENIEHPENGRWEVEINGVKVSAFRRNGATIKLDADPGPNAKVRVTFSWHR